MTVDPDGALRRAALREIDEQIRRRQKGEAATAEPGGGGIPTGVPATSRGTAPAERDAEEAERQWKMKLVGQAMADHHRRQEKDVKDLLSAVAAQTGVPLAQLMEVGPLRADAASIMHHARRLAGG